MTNIKQGKKPDFRALASKITNMFKDFDEKRQKQLNDIKAVQDKVYNLNEYTKAAWHSTLTLPNVYEQHQTLKAHLIESVYSSPEGLFDVSTANGEDEEMAVKQKIMLTDALEKIKISGKIEQIINNIVETGECTLFVGWKTVYKTVRRIIKDDKSTFVLEKRKVFDGADVKTIAPQDFVFDVEKASNWESCPKIFRTFQTLDEIKSNNYNSFESKEAEDALILGMTASENKSYSPETGFKSGLVELLEYWGDIDLGCGKILKNYLVVVAGRQTIVRFEPNPYIECPFIYANLIENPSTKRGVSPLKSILALNEVATGVLNHQLDAYSLMVNPPYLAPKGAFRGIQEVSPGKIIEYDSSLLPQMPTPLNFSGAINGWDFVEFFKNTIEGTTGIYRTMAGSVADGTRTATELHYSANGQNARLNLAIDTINRKLILPMIEKIADTIANFKFGNEVVVRVLDGKTKFFEITDEIRGASYVYRYSDKKASMERKWRQKELGDTINTFSKIPEFAGKIDWTQCFKLALEGLGIENSEKFLKKDED